jgi:hypothetical protein
MDFAALDTKKAAEKGAFLHLKHPALGNLLWDGEGDDRKPIGVYVRGMESRTVQDTLKRIEADRLKGESDGDDLSFVASLIIGFTGAERDGKPLTAEDAKWFFGLSVGFVEQVVSFAKDRASFFRPAATA